eukprot:1843050-Ditylum_brightwellii.AAC.1
MIKHTIYPQKLSDKKVTAESESDSDNSYSNELSDDEEEQDNNEENPLPITQDETTDSETVTKELSEDKTSMQVVIEDKQKNQ